MQKEIPLLDLRAQHSEIRAEVLEAVTRVIDAQRFILGEEVAQLEQEIGSYCHTRFAVGCASGSDALLLALMALGVGPGDEVLTTPYTFFATVGAIVRTGATPVFVDVEPETFNMDMNQAADALARHRAIRAVIPIHLFGACADMDPLLELAQQRGVPVIEDAAQSIGAEYKGRRAGSLGAVGCFSFFPSKNLGGYGDGGMLTTNDGELAARLAALRVHGSKRKYIHDLAGINSRLDALQAAVLRVKLRHLDCWTAGRQQHAAVYRKRFGELGIPATVPAPAAHTTRHVYNQFMICAERRDQLQASLAGQGIGTEVYYPLPLHLQPCFEYLGHKRGDFPRSERLASQALSLPVYAELPEEDLERICGAVQRFYGTPAIPGGSEQCESR